MELSVLDSRLEQLCCIYGFGEPDFFSFESWRAFPRNNDWDEPLVSMEDETSLKLIPPFRCALLQEKMKNKD